jgi:glucan phosphoethanolaminetransferase (alkaline phosphatase superfamily)
VEGSITFSQLGQLIIFLLVVVAGGYVITTLRNVNAAAKNIGAVLKESQEALNQVIPSIATASENLVAITNDLRTGLGETSKAIEAPDQIATCIMAIGETAKALANLFTAAKKL